MITTSHNSKRILMAGAALAALVAPVAAHAQTAADTSGTPITTSSDAPANVAPTQMYGKLKPFWDDGSGIVPLYGKLKPFWGDLSPFYGKIKPFWGDVTPWTSSAVTSPSTFFPTTYDQFWGGPGRNPYTSSNKFGIDFSQVGPFWEQASTNWATVQSAWDAAQTNGDATQLAKLFQSGVLDPANKFWSAAVIKTTGAPNFYQGFANAQLAKAGITFNGDGSINGASLLNLSPSDRAMFFLNWYDGLMDYSGTGHIDWWMGAVHWTPALGEIAGTVGTTRPSVGMIDFSFQSGVATSKKVIDYGSGVTDGHGAAVSSLIKGATDSSGVLGVVPQISTSVNVAVYNPYDSTGTTNWTDVGTGIYTLLNTTFLGKTAPVSVINASLGVPGWTLNPGWNTALANAGAAGHNLVIAAGNEGAVQTDNVPWDFKKNPNIIIVGSIGPDGTISNFSNKPGEACLLPTAVNSTVCSEANKLKYRFIVAPGELILVSDGQGGHFRQSGTSLAAPLVTGAIALLQVRWPWLSNYADETAQIILKSATPLGTNPGADATYGVGVLNVAASQSPLNWSSMVYYPVVNGTVGKAQTLSQVTTQLKSGTQSSWNTQNLYYTAIENIGRTHRDFKIPLSSALIGQRVSTEGGNQLQQSYLTAGLRSQGLRLNALALSGGTGLPSSETVIGDLRFRLSVDAVSLNPAFSDGRTALATSGEVRGEGGAVKFGYGRGAAALDGRDGTAFDSDYDLFRGGANPLLGLASGGAYLNGEVSLNPHLSVSFGATQRHDLRNVPAMELATLRSGATYDAHAEQVRADYRVSRGVTFHASLATLSEASALLGTQSSNPDDLRGGSTSRSASLGFDVALPHALSVSGSATLANTRTAGGQLGTSAGGLWSGAGQLSLAKAHVLGGNDYLRVTVASPLHGVAGRVRYQSYGVVDRDTGELGIIDQFARGTRRVPVSGGLAYGRNFLRGKGQLAVFGTAVSESDESGNARFDKVAGAQLGIAF